MKDWAISFLAAVALIALVLWCVRTFWWVYAG